VNGNIFNSKGVHVGVVTGDAVFGLKGQKLYDLKGSNIYKLNGDLVGHLSDPRGEAFGQNASLPSLEGEDFGGEGGGHLALPSYSQAVKWARLEGKSYNIPEPATDFPDNEETGDVPLFLRPDRN